LARDFDSIFQVVVNEDASEAASDDEEGGAWEFTQTQPEAFFAAPDLMPQEDTKAKAKSTSSVRLQVDLLKELSIHQFDDCQYIIVIPDWIYYFRLSHIFSSYIIAPPPSHCRLTRTNTPNWWRKWRGTSC